MDSTNTHTEPSGADFVRRKSTRRSHTAVPDDSNAIRFDFDEDEPSALVFNDQALPSALVSWSWCQLTMLDEFLVAIMVAGESGTGEPKVAGAVRTVIGPVINALAFSEERASAMCNTAPRRQARARERAHGDASIDTTST